MGRKLISSIYNKGHMEMRQLWTAAAPAIKVARSQRAQRRRRIEQSASMSAKERFALEMRQNPTHLESTLRSHIERVIRWRVTLEFQYIVRGFIVDFYIPELQLAIESDGPHHQNQLAYDHKRDSIIRRSGVDIIRFDHNAIYGDPRSMDNRIRSKLNSIIETRRKARLSIASANT